MITYDKKITLSNSVFLQKQQRLIGFGKNWCFLLILTKKGKEK